MARIAIPEGDGTERSRVYRVRPLMAEAVTRMNVAVYEQSQLDARLRELIRYRIAELNGCPV
jgi:alkylhydroperoxidase family enzyme